MWFSGACLSMKRSPEPASSSSASLLSSSLSSSPFFLLFLSFFSFLVRLARFFFFFLPPSSSSSLASSSGRSDSLSCADASASSSDSSGKSGSSPSGKSGSSSSSGSTTAASTGAGATRERAVSVARSGLRASDIGVVVGVRRFSRHAIDTRAVGQRILICLELVRADRKQLAVLVVIGLSAPMALALESVLRSVLLPPEFEEVRRWLGPMLTPWVWAMVPATFVATLIGVRLQAWVLHREYARLRRR